jgi:voltage-gated potassium channel
VGKTNWIKLEEYESKTSRGLTLLLVLFTAILLFQIFLSDQSSYASLLDVASWVIWALFAVDFGIKVALAEDRWRWVRTHPIDVLTVALPLLRPLRLVRILPVIINATSRLRKTYAGRGVIVAASTMLLVTIPSALVIYKTESQLPGSHIKSVGDAVWWALTTATTVGYGDTFPVSDLGRILSALVMFSGIAFIGILTASIAAWFVELDEEPELTKSDFNMLMDRIDELERNLRNENK